MQATSQKSKPSKAIYSILANVTLQNKDFNSKFVFTFMFAFSMSHGQIVEKYRDTLLNCVVKRIRAKREKAQNRNGSSLFALHFIQTNLELFAFGVTKKVQKSCFYFFSAQGALFVFKQIFPSKEQKDKRVCFA